MELLPEFVAFPKISRWSREVIVAEKIDGTNACILVSDRGDDLIAGRRNGWLTAETDNFGFHRWAMEHRAELLQLGPGAHFGEWWGAGIGRRYGLSEKRFSLFNVSRWSDPATRPDCCSVVPVLWRGPMDQLDIFTILANLERNGSIAAPGFMKPEGIVIFHVAAGVLFKNTLEKDSEPKGKVSEE